MDTIEVTINKDGTVTLHVKGVKGTTCLELTAAVAEKLGIHTGTELTSDAFEGDGGESQGVTQTC